MIILCEIMTFIDDISAAAVVILQHLFIFQPPTLFLEVPQKKQGRSKSLDMTARSQLAGAKRLLFGRHGGALTPSNQSPSSSCVSSETELNNLGTPTSERKFKKKSHSPSSKGMAQQCQLLTVITECGLVNLEILQTFGNESPLPLHRGETLILVCSLLADGLIFKH